MKDSHLNMTALYIQNLQYNFMEEIISFSVPFEQQSGYLALSLFCAAKSTIFKQ